MSNNQPKNTFALTTPIYYVNQSPHIGNTYTTVAADAIARFHRLCGRPVMFITGTDEHGQKIERSAKEAGRTPQEQSDEIAGRFADLWQKLNIKNDRFIRTTDPRHQAIVKEFFNRVAATGDIYLGRQQGYYCVACEEFKDERELLPEQYCPLHPNQKVEWRDEENYFFRLSKYQQKLEELYKNNPNFIQPETRRNEVLNFVSQGLQDFSISRVNLEWGIPIPNDPKHTIYVWFDALLAYLTGLLSPEDEPTLENALRRWWPINLHLIGKDILRFHAIYWPAMLMSAGLPLPGEIFGHGFLTKDGQKISKTLGNTVDPLLLIDRSNSDAVRYFLLKEIEFGKDGDYNETRFINTINADLANDLGNLLNRTLGMVKKYCHGAIPAIKPAQISQSNPLKKIGFTLGNKVAAHYEKLEFSQACLDILELVRRSNKYIDEKAPWTLYKEGQQHAVEEVLYSVLESVRLAAYLLSPITPNLSTEIYHQLGYPLDLNAMSSNTEPQKIANSSLVYQPADINELLSANKTNNFSDTKLLRANLLEPFLKAPQYLRDSFKDYNRPLVIGAGVIAVLAAAGISIQIVKDFGKIPLISPLLEVIGIAYTGWFIARYFTSPSGREKLMSILQKWQIQVLGEVNPGQTSPSSPAQKKDIVADNAPYDTHSQWGLLTENQTLGEVKPAFQRIDP